MGTTVLPGPTTCRPSSWTPRSAAISRILSQRASVVIPCLLIAVGTISRARVMAFPLRRGGATRQHHRQSCGRVDGTALSWPPRPANVIRSQSRDLLWSLSGFSLLADRRPLLAPGSTRIESASGDFVHRRGSPRPSWSLRRGRGPGWRPHTPPYGTYGIADGTSILSGPRTRWREISALRSLFGMSLEAVYRGSSRSKYQCCTALRNHSALDIVIANGLSLAARPLIAGASRRSGSVLMSTVTR